MIAIIAMLKYLPHTLVQKMRETSIASESSMVSAYFRMRPQDGGRLGIQREAPQLIAWSLWESPCFLEWG